MTSVVEFCGRESTGADFSKKKNGKRKKNYDLTFTDVHMSRQKVPKSDFLSQFSMSKVIRIFLIFFSLKNISLEEGFFAIVIFFKLHFLNHFVF